MSSSVLDDEIVVGEAVALDVARAGFGRRMLSGFIDAVIQVLVLILAFIGLGNVLDDLDLDLALIEVAILLVTLFGLLAWPVVWEVATRGRSPGKFVTGARVVRLDGGAIVYRHALIRGLIGLVECWMVGFTVAAVAVLVSRRSQRLGDMAAGTMVVRERVPLRLPPPAIMPPHLANWAAKADVSTLGPTLAINIRQYLQRRGQLSPLARERVAQSLCTQVAAHVAPQPPPCHPDDFLSAVLAERGRRDRRRLAEARALSERLLGRAESVPFGAVHGVAAQPPGNPPHSYGP